MLVLGANDDHFFGELFLSRQILFEEIHDILAKNSVGIKTNIPTLLRGCSFTLRLNSHSDY